MPWCKNAPADAPLEYSSFENLLEILAEERRLSLKRRRFMACILVGYLLLVTFICAVVVIKHQSMASMSGCFGAFGSMAAGLYALSQKQRKGIAALSQFDDIRMVPRLVELLDYPNQKYSNTVSAMLIRLLPRLQASDAGLLTAEHHAVINKFLGRKIRTTASDVSLYVAILKAMEQVGDASSVAVVEALAAGSGASRSQPTLQGVAEECLPALRLRATHQLQMATLLRAADGVGSANEVLLRPVDTTPSQVEPSELLRSVDADSPVRDRVKVSTSEKSSEEGIVNPLRRESERGGHSVGAYATGNEAQEQVTNTLG